MPLRYASIISVLLLVVGCNRNVPEFELVEQDPKLTVHYELLNNGQSVDIGDEFIDTQGYKLLLRTLKLYVSELKLSSSSGSHTLTDVCLVNFNDFQDGQINDFVQSYDYIIPADEYTSVSFGIGLTEDQNAQDPTIRDKDDPLSSIGGMYWDWGSKYVFVMIEAGIDSDLDGVLDDNIGFHTGFDELFFKLENQSVELPLESFDKDTLTISIDWNKLFPTTGETAIDLSSAPFVHANTDDEKLELARRFTVNFRNALSAK